MHEVIREESLKAWEIVQNGERNPLKETLSQDERILKYLTKEEVITLLDASDYIGDAAIRTQRVIDKAKAIL